MISVSMNCCKRLGAALLLAAASLPVLAHKASDAYLQLKAGPAGTELRVDVALRDLDVALDLDADGDGRLTWREVRSAWPAIEDYLRARVAVSDCAWTTAARTLETRSDGVYAALSLRSDCVLDAVPAIRYTVLREVDATHRGIARIGIEGRDAVLRVLDPTHPAVLSMGRASRASVAASGMGGSTGTSAAESAPVVASTTSPVDRGADPRAVSADSDASLTQFLAEGVRHILTGYDHVLFLLCLLLPSVVRRGPAGWEPVQRLRDALWPVLSIVTAFTLAHSITLALAATRLVSLSPAVIEPAIAVTIVLAAIDNLWPLFGTRRAVVTFAFGLVHGFGFADVLAELNLPPLQFAWALLQFNLGIELGQLIIVAIAVSLLFLVRSTKRYPAWALQGGSCAAALLGGLWFVERTAHVSLLPL